MAPRYKRRYGRYRNRYNRYRRRYGRYRNRYNRSKRFKKRRSKVEYKRVEGYRTKVFDLSYGNVNPTDNEPNAPDNAQKALYGQNNVCFGIGSHQNTNWTKSIDVGTYNSQRIGTKINPVKLRIYGTVSLVNPSHQRLSEQPLTVYMRCIVYQVRNGIPSSKYIYDDGFSAVSPVFNATNGAMLSITGKRLFSEFHGEEGYTYNVSMQGQYTYNLTSVIYDTNLNAYTSLTKVPYRNGIGGSMKLLKDKLYKLNVSKNSSFSFRFKTRKPNRMVWPEDPNRENAILTTCRNPIYITWWMIPTTPYAYSRFITDDNQSIYNEGSGVIHLDFGYQMYYTDS